MQSTPKKNNLTVKILALLSIVFFIFLFSAPEVYAIDLPCVPSSTADGVTYKNDVFNCVNKLYLYGLVMSTIAAVFMIVLAGYLYIFSGGNESRVGTAKSFISTSLIGLAVLVVGFLILQQINPEILNVKNIATNQIGQQNWYTFDGSELGGGPPVVSSGKSKKGGERSLGSFTGGDGSLPGQNQSFSDLGCSYDSVKQKNEVGQIVAALYTVVKEICSTIPGARISSVIGQGSHTDNSLHYSGCAVDFGNDTTSKEGQQIIAFARAKGLVVNPGADANQTYHVHISLGSYCGKK